MCVTYDRNNSMKAVNINNTVLAAGVVKSFKIMSLYFLKN